MRARIGGCEPPASACGGERRTHDHSDFVQRLSEYNGNQTANKIRVAESEVSGAREALRVLEESVLLSAATIYMDYLRDAAILEVQKSNTRALEQTLTQMQDRFNVGEVTRTDVAQSSSCMVFVGRASPGNEKNKPPQ
jgi:outer membrane protein TolC